jgi:hypothetical protein
MRRRKRGHIPLLPEAGNMALVAQDLEVLAEPRPKGIKVLL